jgi:16S rRNA (guanine527-N7)-methyltransferase
MVQDANRHVNLTALSGRSGFIRLVVDSLTAARAYDGGAHGVDVGSGAGYPGLVLAALYPEAPWTLVESVQKKARFLSEAAAALGLGRVRVVAARAEALAASQREGFGFAVARAVGSLPLVAELTVPLVAVGGAILLMRGPEGAQELHRTAPFLHRLGAGAPNLDTLDLPEEAGRRVLVGMRKIAETPPRYPRRGGALGRWAPAR